MLKSTLVVAVLALAGVLVGCADDDPKPAATPTTAAEPSDPATSGIISPALPDIPEFSNKRQGAIDDVTQESCDQEPGPVTASGEATNSGEFPRDVVVVMSWTVGSTGDVVARGITAVEDLEPGDSAPWSVEADLPGDVPAQCVLSAYAGQLTD